MIPKGLCQCGCGLPTTVEKRRVARAGIEKGEPRAYRPGHHMRGKTREQSPAWHGGRTYDPKGYVRVLAPDHPRARLCKGYVFEHVLVAERALGRYLPKGAQIHHVDECKANNAPSNLVICPDTAYHALLHRRARALAACGNADAIPCDYCKSFDRQDEILTRSLWKKRPHTARGFHPECRRAYGRKNKLSLRMRRKGGEFCIARELLNRAVPT